MVSLFSCSSRPVGASHRLTRFYALRCFPKENGTRAATWGRPYGIFRSLPKRRVREAAPYVPAPATSARQSQAQKWNCTNFNFRSARAQWPGWNLECHSNFHAPEGPHLRTGEHSRKQGVWGVRRI